MKKLIVIVSILTTFFCNGQEQKEYAILLKEISNKKDALQQNYTASNPTNKDSIISTARDFLIHTMTKEVFPQWYGTQWDFNGTTRTPKKGKIACGYFVTNTLTDVGFTIPRVKWAQSASEIFIKKLAFGDVNRFVNKPISDIKKFLKKSGNGLYLVGLDMHTGFVFVNDEQIKFIHADYYEPEKGVVSENIDSDSPIADSSYRVFGKLMSDAMIVKWLTNTRIE